MVFKSNTFSRIKTGEWQSFIALDKYSLENKSVFCNHFPIFINSSPAGKNMKIIKLIQSNAKVCGLFNQNIPQFFRYRLADSIILMGTFECSKSDVQWCCYLLVDEYLPQ